MYTIRIVILLKLFNSQCDWFSQTLYRKWKLLENLKKKDRKKLIYIQILEKNYVMAIFFRGDVKQSKIKNSFGNGILNQIDSVKIDNSHKF